MSQSPIEFDRNWSQPVPLKTEVAGEGDAEVPNHHHDRRRAS
jgi:hypothetical protein